ncbi:hypothetical protein PoB_007030100 [Plakobranchus ocellatus]|uniref:Uncharacterized protein n=1 Tax=Plakobranchus ocellatus TaxID=259542 RepID=A0AAV4DI16_9GAST|nr:hypothetical protein PoB_007030100 [Plakobranchus ocellatus]
MEALHVKARPGEATELPGVENSLSGANRCDSPGAKLLKYDGDESALLSPDRPWLHHQHHQNPIRQHKGKSRGRPCTCVCWCQEISGGEFRQSSRHVRSLSAGTVGVQHGSGQTLEKKQQ